MFRVEIDTTTRTREGQNPRTRTDVIIVENARDNAQAIEYALSSFSINFPYSGINTVTFTRAVATRQT